MGQGAADLGAGAPKRPARRSDERVLLDHERVERDVGVRLVVDDVPDADEKKRRLLALMSAPDAALPS